MPAFLSNQLVEPGFGDSRVWDLKNAPADTSPDSLLRPETWAHHSGKLKVGDRLNVTPLGLPYFARLIVMDVGKAFAKLALLDVTWLNATAEDFVSAHDAKAEAPAPAATLPDDAPVSVRWNLGTKKYAIYRKSDGVKINDGSSIKADAIAWAIDHIGAMAA